LLSLAGLTMRSTSQRLQGIGHLGAVRVAVIDALDALDGVPACLGKRLPREIHSSPSGRAVSIAAAEQQWTLRSVPAPPAP
jgi:hypothetical protein